MDLAQEDIDRVVEAALTEDVGSGDATTLALVPADARCRAELLLEELGVVCGVPIAAAVFRALDPSVTVEAKLEEGTAVSDVPALIAVVEGPAQAILTGERAALNFVGRLCGIAALTRRFAELTDGTPARILDTRKTTPGLRALEKYAVRCGGGTNHRAGLYDGILIKENHILAAGGIRPALENAYHLAPPGATIQIEVESLKELHEALEAGAKLVLLDNFSLDDMRTAVKHTAGRAELEASGGVNLQTVRTIAETGVDRISIGGLTKDVLAIDLSMRFA